MQLRHCGINPDTLRRMLVSHDIQQSLLLLLLHTPILSGGSEENLLFQLRRLPRVPLLHRTLERNVRYIQTPHVSNVLAQSQVAVDVLAIQRVRCVAATQPREACHVVLCHTTQLMAQGAIDYSQFNTTSDICLYVYNIYI